ncbi:hypothetical protein EJB05_14368 [Eragrostis curvula]|uniref:F-box associated domain-containing protein n=1 Tax=Eragrostis curvula TaxID=38414 RepID=A0A5J9VZ28_9POAL|nr:hypothetical protein EJB05_14368 [Eragrostis curvula]
MGNPLTAQACLYSSESGAWSEPASIQLHIDLDSRISSGITSETAPAALVGEAVYFIGDFSNEIMRYDLAAQSLSVIDPPDIYFPGHYGIMVTPVDDGRLGILVMNYDNLCLWEMDPDEGYEWVKRWVIDLDKLLDGNCDSPPTLSGFDVGTNSILVNTDDGGVYTIELKSLQAKKVCQMADSYCDFLYTCFLTPVQQSKAQQCSSFHNDMDNLQLELVIMVK